jgi:hypothetical protein
MGDESVSYKMMGISEILILVGGIGGVQRRNKYHGYTLWQGRLVGE